MAHSHRTPPRSRPVIAIVADDLTGAGDVAGILARCGVRTAVVVGRPDDARPVPDADAVVVGLRIRTAPVSQAVEWASDAARWLGESHPDVLAWKVCSTFDSTPRGNIGPVADALLDIAGLSAALVCPAFPENGRTVEGGRLLVHGVPLDQTSMRDHPLTPMRDARLATLLAPQVRAPGRVVGLGVDPEPAGAIDRATRDGARYLVADARTDDDCMALGVAAIGRTLPVMASGLVAGLVSGLRDRGLLGEPTVPDSPEPIEGPTLLLVGSCSVATRRQVEAFATHGPVIRYDPTAPDAAGRTIDHVRDRFAAGDDAVLVASSDDPEGVARVAESLGPRAGAAIEAAMGSIGAAAAADGVRRFVIAGGETTGAVLEALGVRELRVGPEIAPGVPLLERVDGPRMLVVGKSGNFGGPDVLRRAIGAMDAAR